MAETKNALAELAHWLECDVRTLETASVAQLNRIRKASRIIATPAKAKVDAIKENPSMAGGAFINLMSECRAIAEPGEENEKRN